MANERVKSSQKGKEMEGDAPQKSAWLPSLKERTPKKASYSHARKMVPAIRSS